LMKIFKHNDYMIKVLQSLALSLSRDKLIRFMKIMKKALTQDTKLAKARLKFDGQSQL